MTEINIAPSFGAELKVDRRDGCRTTLLTLSLAGWLQAGQCLGKPHRLMRLSQRSDLGAGVQWHLLAR